MQKNLILGFITLAFLIGACSQKLSEKEYFDAGYDQYNKQNFEEALNNFKLLVKYYPDSELAAKSIFMIGYINANHVNNLDEAKKYYTQFIEKYPNDELVESAKYELATLGKSIDELPIFEKIGKDSVDSTMKK